MNKHIAVLIFLLTLIFSAFYFFPQTVSAKENIHKSNKITKNTKNNEKKSFFTIGTVVNKLSNKAKSCILDNSCHTVRNNATNFLPSYTPTPAQIPEAHYDKNFTVTENRFVQLRDTNGSTVDIRFGGPIQLDHSSRKCNRVFVYNNLPDRKLIFNTDACAYPGAETVYDLSKYSGTQEYIGIKLSVLSDNSGLIVFYDSKMWTKDRNGIITE